MHTTAKRKIINSAICCLLMFIFGQPVYSHTGGNNAAKLFPPTPASTPSIASTHPRNFRVFGQEANKLVGDIAKSKTKAYEEAQNKLINAKLKAEIAKDKGDEADLANANSEMAAAMDAMKANQADYDTWKNGSALMIALHAVVGGIQANGGGGNALSGALGAGLNEAAIPIADKVFEGMSKDEQNALRQWTKASSSAQRPSNLPAATLPTP